MFKTLLTSLVLVFAGGVSTPSALDGLEGIEMAYQTDECPDSYRDTKYLYEKSMKAHGDFFLNQTLPLEEYEKGVDNFKVMLRELKSKLPRDEYSKLEYMYLDDMEFQLKRMEDIKHNLMVFEEDQVIYVKLANTPTHKLALGIRQNIKEFYRLVWSR